MFNFNQSSLSTDAAVELRGGDFCHEANSQSSQITFLRELFHSLETTKVRYCVLQRWDALQGELDTDHDIDLAVHPGDVQELIAAWQLLSELGYKTLQVLNHAVGSYAFIFGWFDETKLRTIMVDIAFEHRQAGLIWASGEQLIMNRQRPGNFWVAAPQTEFAYLLVKKMLKGTFNAVREQRFAVLIERMGRFDAENIAAELFGEKQKRAVVSACLQGSPAALLHKLRRRFLWSRFARNPFSLARYLVADGMRLAHRWVEPTGICVAIDGSVGESKERIAKGLAENIGVAFGSHKTFRFSQSYRSSDQSAGLFGSFRHKVTALLDYGLRIRPLLVRTGLIVTGGELSSCSVSRKTSPSAPATEHLMPHADVTLVLQRPSEAQPTEHLSTTTTVQSSVDAGICVLSEETESEWAVQQATVFVVEFLSQRALRRHAEWLESVA